MIRQAAPQTEMEQDTIKQKNNTSSKALRSVTDQLVTEKNDWAWSETFDVTVPTPLPFGSVSEIDGTIISIHDDLKREVTFYNAALEAVLLAKTKCEVASIPFSRPDDFFAEMVKTDGMYSQLRREFRFIAVISYFALFLIQNIWHGSKID
jgi:Eukaryotic rRNA processing protein EBP2